MISYWLFIYRNSMYLYKIYKLIKQRSVRDHPYCELRSEMTQLARQIFEGKKSAEDILSIASELKSIETQIYGIRTYFSDKIKYAVKSGNYSLEFPDVISHVKYGDEKIGSIYILTSSEKKGQSKLGATTMDPNKRLSIFINRYGYDADFYYISEGVRAPFKLEKSIADEIRHLRVSGLEFGDSIEWYFINPKVLKTKIIKAIKTLR